MSKRYITNVLLISMSILMSGCTPMEVPAETVIAAEAVFEEASGVSTEAIRPSVEALSDKVSVEVSGAGVSTEAAAVTAAEPEAVHETKSVAELSGITAADKTMYVVSSVNVRVDATVDSDKLGGLRTGDSVHVTGLVSNKWIRIDYNGVSAYVSGKYLSDIKAEASVKASAPASVPQETASSVPPETVAAPVEGNVFDGDFPVSTQTPEEAAEEVRQAFIDAGWIDENGNHIDGGNWTQ